MAEKISSSDLAQQLGAWFREAGNLVTKSGGTIDKFIGDAILAYWSGCKGEVDCAGTLEIAKQMLALTDPMKWTNGDPFRVGVALHFGRVTCGNVGLDAQRDAGGAVREHGCSGCAVPEKADPAVRTSRHAVAVAVVLATQGCWGGSGRSRPGSPRSP